MQKQGGHPYDGHPGTSYATAGLDGVSTKAFPTVLSRSILTWLRVNPAGRSRSPVSRQLSIAKKSRDDPYGILRDLSLDTIFVFYLTFVIPNFD